jgi:uncharacterized delta-60 repeat protein
MHLRTTPLLAAALMLGPGTASALHEGQLDPEFGSSGRRVVAFDLAEDLADAAFDTIVAPDGKVYLLGRATSGEFLQTSIAITRLLPNGDIDTDYGENGRSAWLEPSWFGMRGSAGVLLPDGALLVAGRVRKTGNYNEHAVICRFDAEGGIDVDFGDPATPGCRAYARGGWSGLALAANGDLLAAGTELLDGDFKAIVARLDDDGVLIPTFGTAGRAVRGADAYFTDVAEGNDGRLVAIGVSDNFSGTPRALISAFTDDGEPDYDFADSAGTVQLSAGSGRIFWGQAVEVAADGSYVMAASAELEDGGLRPVVLRLWPDGAAYTGFAPFGFRIYDLCEVACDFRGENLHVSADGRITVVGGYNPDQGAGNADMYAMRLFANGQPDTDFGDRDPDLPGMTLIGFDLVNGQSSDYAYDVAMQGDRVILAGSVASTKGEDDTDFAVARLTDGVALFSDGFE